jgi:Ca2+/Na+ antiporter
VAFINRTRGTILGAFIGLIVGVILYASIWVTPYVRGMPWSVALFLDVVGYWLLAQYNFSPGLFVVLVFMASGGLVGLAIDLVQNSRSKRKP